MPKLFSVLVFMLLLISCGEKELYEKEGFINVEGGKMWYKIVGNGNKTPIVLLHGGPAFPSYYMEPLKELADERPVIFYDQLGSGRSDVTTDPSLWTIEQFVTQLAKLREELELDEIHILGHSWGTQLALDYMLTKPSGVQSIILASPAINSARWAVDNKNLLKTLSEKDQQIIQKHEKQGTTGSKEYREATMRFYKLYMSRSEPWSEDLNKAFEMSNNDIYGYMWGAADWEATGSLKDYNREAFLPELDLPVLFTAGRFDEATPETVSYFKGLVPGAQMAILENSAHITMQDEPKEYNRIIREFLTDVESR